ncbi:MAG: hypothetical protein MUC48_21215 [Leptolyngbya sp. Prado105]|jgi:hypothetical protein|nr:hypothetical protein [Leptolyngbya sp. Prado105]
MVATKRRSPTSTLVSKDSISGASSALKNLPEKPKEIWSLREAISLLKDQIILALDRGYTYTEVSQMLSSKGVEISPSTLKYYLSSARKEDSTGTKSRRRRRTLSMSAEDLQNGSEALDNAQEEAPAAEPKTTQATAKVEPKTTAKKATKTATKPAAKTKTTTAKTTKTTTRKKSAS